MSKFVRPILLFAAALLAAAPSLAQTDDDVIKVDTRLVDVPVVVTDRGGRALTRLGKENFEVFEDGQRQEIAEFRTTEAPFEVALLLDTSGSTRSDLDLIRRAAASFIGSLRPGDRVAVISFRTERSETAAFAVSEIVIGLTDDRKALETALNRVSTSNGTPYYDSLLKVVGTVFREKPKPEFRGRRALVALTDGVDSSSAAEFEEVRFEFEEAGIVSYFVKVDTREFFEENLLGDCAVATRLSAAQIRRYYTTYFPKAKIEKIYDFCKIGDFERLAMSKGLYELADRQMDLLAKVSGGGIFPISGLPDARAAFRAVAEEIGTNYSIGYYSTNEKRDGTYRRIKVTVRNVPPGTIVRSREGYTAK